MRGASSRRWANRLQRYFVIWLRVDAGHARGPIRRCRASLQRGTQHRPRRRPSRCHGGVRHAGRRVGLAARRHVESRRAFAHSSSTEFPDLSAWPAALALVEAVAGKLGGGGGAPAPGRGRSRCHRLRGDLDPGDGRDERSVPELDDGTPRPSIYERLEPYAGMLCVVSLNLSELGPVSRALGVLATLMGTSRPRRSTSPTHSPRASGSARHPTSPARRSTWRACC